MKNRVKRLAAAGAAAALLLTVGACSNGGGSSSTPASSAATAPGLAAATAYVAQHSSQPTGIGVTGALSKKPTGKVAEFVQCGVGTCKQVADQLEVPLKMLGVTLKRVPAGLTPESFKAAFDQVVQDRPDAVLTTGIPVETVDAELKQLGQLNIPAIMAGVTGTPHDGLKAIYVGDGFLQQSGKLSADWFIKEGGGKDVEVAAITLPAFGFTKPLIKGFQDEFDANCQNCTLHQIVAQGADIGQNVPDKVVSYLQAHPKVKYVFGSSGATLAGVSQALKIAGINGVKVFSQTGEAANLENVKAGSESATAVLSFDFLTWVMANSVAHLLVGDPLPQVDDSRIPWEYIVDSSNLTFDPKALPSGPGPVDFKSQFKKLWGISS